MSLSKLQELVVYRGAKCAAVHGVIKSFLLSKDGSLMFQQVPMVEIDGMKLVQTRAILNYIATKYDLYGKDMKERALYGIFSVLS